MLRSRKAAFGPDFAIRIDSAVELAAGPGFVAAGYDEIQANRPGLLRRRATALFRPDPAAGPNGLRWLAVHETWLPDTA